MTVPYGVRESRGAVATSLVKHTVRSHVHAWPQGKRLVLTGCLAQRYGKDLAEQVPEADLIVGFERYGELAGALKEALGMPPGES